MPSDPDVYMVWFWIFFGLGIFVAVMRWATASAVVPAYVPPKLVRGAAAVAIPDQEALDALLALGFNRAAAIGALNASGWSGANLEERVTNALRAHPTYMKRTNGDIVREEAVATLAGLGWSRRESIAALTNSQWGGPGDPSVEDMVRAALKTLPNHGMK